MTCAEVMGSTSIVQILAFFISCFYAGIAGSLWAHWIQVVHPSSLPSFTPSGTGDADRGGNECNGRGLLRVIFLRCWTNWSCSPLRFWPRLSLAGTAPGLVGITLRPDFDDLPIFEPRGSPIAGRFSRPLIVSIPLRIGKTAERFGNRPTTFKERRAYEKAGEDQIGILTLCILLFTRRAIPRLRRICDYLSLADYTGPLPG